MAFAGLAGCNQQQQPPPKEHSQGPQPIMKVSEVRPGMRGYGLSVFHGTKIEPFPVKVISISHNATPDPNSYAPNTDAIWIQCTDERMTINGPVQGMSGSPIYLWDEHEPKQLGRGGRLIGAFAFGFSESKICYVGVQPIENMRKVGERASVENNHRLVSQTPAPETPKTGPRAAQTLRRLLDMGQAIGVSPGRMWRAQAIGQLVGAEKSDALLEHTSLSGPTGVSGAVMPMLLPVAVRSPQMARAIAPLFAPAGMMPMATGHGVLGSKPPPDVDMSKVRFEPGSVLNVPMVWGDADISGAGTVTDIMPDGRVLAFGHAMNGVGDVALPVATGYVHLVMARVGMSFKISGIGNIQGALIRDENSAVVSSAQGIFKSSPMHVVVNQLGQSTYEYNYQIIQDKQLTPILAAILASDSIDALKQSPLESTLHMQADMVFEDDYRLSVNSTLPGAGLYDILYTILPPLASMVQNNHESKMMKSITLKMISEPGLNFGTLTQARLDRNQIAPGNTLGINLKIHPYGKKAVEHRIEFPIPEDLDDGSYQLLICDGQTYLQTLLSSRPHLMMTRSVDDQYMVLKRILAVRDDAIYVMMQLPERGLALGQLELPRLPSSRVQMIASPASTLATPFFDSLEQIEPMDMVIKGSLRFVVHIDRMLSE
jgi:hypothetical protein